MQRGVPPFRCVNRKIRLNVERMSHVEQAKLFSKNEAGLEKFFSCLEKSFSSVEKSFSSRGKNFSTITRFSWKYYEALECFVVWLYEVDNLLIAKGEALKKQRYARAWLHIKTCTPLYNTKGSAAVWMLALRFKLRRSSKCLRGVGYFTYLRPLMM